MTRYKYTDQELREAVASSGSVRQVLQKLNIVAAGGNYSTTNNRIKKLGIDTSHFHGMLWNKGKKLGPKQPIDYYLKENSRIGSHKLKKRLLVEGLKTHQCEICGIIEWRGQPTPLELDHINGNHNDNRLENLRVICPNCHAQTPTYRGKNKGRCPSG